MFVGVGRLRAMGHGGRALRMNMFMFLDEALDFFYSLVSEDLQYQLGSICACMRKSLGLSPHVWGAYSNTNVLQIIRVQYNLIDSSCLSVVYPRAPLYMHPRNVQMLHLQPIASSHHMLQYRSSPFCVCQCRLEKLALASRHQRSFSLDDVLTFHK